MDMQLVVGFTTPTWLRVPGDSDNTRNALAFGTPERRFLLAHRARMNDAAEARYIASQLARGRGT